MDTGDWRDQLQSESRQRVVHKIMESLKRHFQEENEIEKLAVLFEEKIFSAATSHSDYLEKISQNMMALECKLRNNVSSYANGSKQSDHGGCDSAFMNALMTNLLSQGQQSQPAEQQFMLQIQSLSAQLQQGMSLQEQVNPLQFYLQQRHQASVQAPGSMFQAQNVMNQQEHLYQSQIAIKETPTNSTMETGHANGGDWQEEAYQKLKQMEEMYLPELNEMYQKIVAKLQHDSLLQQPNWEQLEKLKIFKSMMERIMSMLQMSKNSIQPGFKEKLGSYEKQIINFINTNRPRRPIPPMLQGQLSQPYLQSMLQTQSQIPQVQSRDTQMNPQMQTMNMQGSVSGMQQNNMSSLQHNSVSSMSSSPSLQQNMMYQLQSGSNMVSGQGNAISSAAQTGHANGGDWQEEAFQKLKQMKESYFPDLNEMYLKLVAKLQQHDSEQPEKLKIFKSMLERIMSILLMSKNNIQPGLKEKLGSYEKQIVNFINTNRPRRHIPPLQQGQLSQQHLQSMQLSQSQIPEVQSYHTQMNPQVQTVNNMSSLQQWSSMSSAPMSQQNTMHQVQSDSCMDFEEGK